MDMQIPSLSPLMCFSFPAGKLTGQTNSLFLWPLEFAKNTEYNARKNMKKYTRDASSML